MTREFRHDLRQLKHETIFERVDKGIKRIVKNPELGRPLRHKLKGLHAVRISPFRLIYKIEYNKIVLRELKHRKRAYG